MKNFSLLLLFFALTIFSNCGSDDAQPECEPAVINPYLNCCGIEPLEAELGTGIIFVPNIITPNFDGANDLLLPYTNDNITSIKSFIVKDESGQEIFQKFDIMAGPFPNNGNGWNGTDGQGNVVNGLFDYEITIINVDNEEATFTGKVCSIDCEAGVVPSENINNCGFPSQHNGQGNLDLNLPNLESDCF